MMFKKSRIFVGLCILVVCIFAVVSCQKNVDDKPVNTDSETTDAITKDTSQETKTNRETENHFETTDLTETTEKIEITETTETAEKEDPRGDNYLESVSVDLNHDKVIDKIVISIEDVEGKTATLKVISGKDGTEIMSKTHAIGDMTMCAYYITWNQYKDAGTLVCWAMNYYDYHNMVVVDYRVYDFSSSGEIQYQKYHSGQAIYHLEDGKVNRAQEMNHESLYKNFYDDHIAYSVSKPSYVLINTFGDELIYSTSDNLVKPQTFYMTINEYLARIGVIQEETSTEMIEETTEEIFIPSEDDEPFYADLNCDGADDEIHVTVDEHGQVASIAVIDGVNGSQLFLDKFGDDSDKKGAYYIHNGKENHIDYLVRWTYVYDSDNNLIFEYEVFRFNADGEVTYEKRYAQKFNVSDKAYIDSLSSTFLRGVKTLNQYIESDDETYNAYLLCSNLDGVLVCGSAENPTISSEVETDLNDFVKSTKK